MAENTAITALAELEALEKEHNELTARITVAAAKSGKDGYTLELHEPIMVGAEKKDSLHFRAHNLKDIRECRGKSDDELAASLAGLSIDTFGQLSSVDAQLAQAVLAGFHLRRAAGGLARKE